MVVHKYVSVEHHGSGAEVVGQLPEKPLSVRIAPKDHVPAVAAAGDVVNCIGEINSGRSSHDYHHTKRRPQRQEPMTATNPAWNHASKCIFQV